MKKVLGLIVFLGIAAAAAHFLSDGGLSFQKSLSEEEQRIAELRSELRAAQTEYRQSGRAAALSGMDTTAEAGAALRRVDRIESELTRLKKELTTDSAKVAAQRLEEEISDFRAEVR
jgi:hypothetical protein